MQPDVVTKLGNSMVQHGPDNDRVYLMKLHAGDMPDIVGRIEQMARKHGYGKLFAKVRSSDADEFVASGFIEEARVPGMVRGEAEARFLCKYLDPDRAQPEDAALLRKVLEVAESKADDGKEKMESVNAEEELTPISLGPEHCESLAALYNTVFETYPFPISEPAYLRTAMENDVLFFGMVEQGEVVAAASAELDRTWRCAEMTDFATLPQMRGRGAAGRLLALMHQRTAELGIATAYTIARAASFGMNVVFARAGYAFGGTLCNNTQIGGRLESMNVWYKYLVPS